MLYVISAILVFLLIYTFPIVKVCGDSMFPTLYDGDIILTCRLYKLKVDSVYVYESPEEKGKFVIKRLKDISDGRLYLVGDNLDNSYDCRHYGPVRGSSIKCKYLCILRKVLN